MFQVEQSSDRDGKDTGCIINARLQNLCSVSFSNGDYFKGIFKDGRPNGKGEMYYKTSLKSTISGVEYEQAQYKGMFRNGKRDGYGKMVWQDGSNFEGIWKNDLRYSGTMLMTSTGWIYKGKFSNDQCHDKKGMLLLPTMTIYQGEFAQGKTTPMGLLMYPNGSIYYGQHSQFIKSGIGKQIEYTGSYQEGSLDGDKMNGDQCRVFEITTGEFYSGPIADGKRNGKGRLYDAERDEVYDGFFEMNKKNGDGMIYKPDGKVMKGEFRNNYMEGQFENVCQLSQAETKKIFGLAKKSNNIYIAINKKAEQKVQRVLHMKNKSDTSCLDSEMAVSPTNNVTKNSKNLLLKM